MKKIIYILASLALVGCQQVSTTWIDLEKYRTQLNEARDFMPSYYTVDGDEATAAIAGKLQAMEESDEVTAEDSRMPHQTTSTNAVGLAKGLFSFWDSGKTESYCGSYWSVDELGQPIRLSGRIIVPKGQRPSRVVVVSHYTIGANSEAPSMSFPLEGILAKRGLALIVPDYIGYGITADRIHPYLCSELTARNVIDMYMASQRFLEVIDKAPINPEIILFGYSQGGATTMAVARQLEYEHPDVNIRLILAGGGPYDICTTYDKMIENNFTDYPCAVPMIIQGMNVGFQLELDYSQFFQKNTLENMDKWINSKRYAMADITTMMGTKKLSDIMTEEACNKVNDRMRDLYAAMLTNSISTSYYPQAPVYLFHSMDDNVVPFVNAENMLGAIQEYCNVQYNFGHYGNHVKGYLRFLFTAIEFLNNHHELDQGEPQK